MPDFEIVDSHVHFIDPCQFSYKWLARSPALKKRWMPADFTHAQGNVNVGKIVFVEAWPDPGQGLREARFVAALAADDCRIGGLVANVPVHDADELSASLKAFREISGVHAVRHLIEGNIDPSICLEPDFVAGVRNVGAAGLVFDICVKNWGLPFATELVRRSPDTVFVLDHIGKPAIRYGLREPWWSEIARLAKHPNVFCKISGVITEADHRNWTAKQVRPFIEHSIECFGMERVMFGSDWPVSELTHRYQDWVEILDEILVSASSDELRRFYRGTATSVYGLSE